jgi:homoserine dehydrogenase
MERTPTCVPKGSGVKRVNLIHIGVGLIGGAAIEQTVENRQRWQRDFGLDLRSVAVIGGEGGVVAEGPEGFEDATLVRIVAGRRAGTPLAEVAVRNGLSLSDGLEVMGDALAMGPAIAIETATGTGTAPLIDAALGAGAALVFSNKAPFAMTSGDPAGDRLWAAAGPGGRVRYETTCGAGLPVISTLRGMIDGGDEVREIVGSVSGTLGAIFSDIAAGKPFSEAVRGAMALGYTEPDPRDDLSGLDVARKALILARTIGRQIDLNEIAIESLVPAHLAGVGVSEFVERCGDLDQEIGERTAAARAAGQALKYVCRVTPDEPISVGVQPIDTSTVLGALQGPENIISMRTRRYDAYPLTVSGPGAGAAVTAAGVMADVLALANGRIGG